MPTKFQNTIIYKIICRDEKIKDLYVGQTTNFTKRKSRHKTNCNLIGTEKYFLFVYEFIRKNGGWDNWMVVELEKFPCENKNQAVCREKYWMKELGATLNKHKYYNDEKEYNQIYNKRYREENKEKIKEYKKNYREVNKEKIKEYNKKYRDLKKLSN